MSVLLACNPQLLPHLLPAQEMPPPLVPQTQRLEGEVTRDCEPLDLVRALAETQSLSQSHRAGPIILQERVGTGSRWERGA